MIRVVVDATVALAWCFPGETSDRADAILVALRGRLLRLARAQGLTGYKAAYRELAIRHSAPLATFNEKLQKAAKLARVRTFG